MPRIVAASLLVAWLVTGCVGSIMEPNGEETLDTPPGAGPIELDPDVACEGPVSVGVAPFSRLTNSQYEHAVADLLAPLAVGAPAQELIPESALGGFRSNATVPVSDLEFRGYADQAERLAELVAAAPMEVVGCSSPPAIEERGCVERFIDRFVTRAYRRPVEPAELTRLLALFDAVRADLSFDRAASAIVEAVLQSPHFLYRVELVPGARSGDVVPLAGYQLAARLSFFLWDTVPDEALLAAAEAGELSTENDLEGWARHMLADPRARRATESFHLQWLGVDEIDEMDKDTDVFPAFDRQLADLMAQETARFSDHVVREGDGTLSTLLTGGFTFLRGDLFELYGLPGRTEEWTRVELDPAQRTGLLTQAGFLAVHSHPNQTSPVHRGKAIRENVLCQSLPAPPPDVDDTAPDPDPDLTTRERFAVHSEVERCAACHQLMDPIGLTFEGYDGIGRLRTMEAGRPVDTSGEIVGTDVAGPLTGAQHLSERVLQSEQARLCVAQNWYRFALGRLETELDECTLSRMYEAFESTDLNVRELLVALVRSDSFRMFRVPEEP